MAKQKVTIGDLSPDLCFAIASKLSSMRLISGMEGTGSFTVECNAVRRHLRAPVRGGDPRAGVTAHRKGSFLQALFSVMRIEATPRTLPRGCISVAEHVLTSAKR
jgi:hypothetical protein